MILSLYITRRLVWSFLLVAGVFLGLLFLLDMVEQVRSFSGREISFAQTAWLAALNVPKTLYQITPLIVVLSSLSTFLALSRSSELVVVRAAGRSGLRLMMVPFMATLLAGALFVAVLNPLVAASTREYVRYGDVLRGGSGQVVSLAADGLWMRQSGEQGQTVIRAQRATPDGTLLNDVTFLTFTHPDGPRVRIEAEVARLMPGAWQISDAKIWQLDAHNPELEAQFEPTFELSTELTPSQIRDSFARPGSIPIWKLPAFIAALERAGFSALEHRVWLQMELALPLMLASMMLMATGSSMYHARGGGAGVRALVTILAGFGLFFLRNFAQVLGENGQIPVFLAAWSLPIATTFMALGLLLHLEDG
jgi:lipopolysaccharide export system permease protein